MKGTMGLRVRVMVPVPRSPIAALRCCAMDSSMLRCSCATALSDEGEEEAISGRRVVGGRRLLEGSGMTGEAV